MKIQPQKLGFLCVLTLCLAVGCKAIYVDKRSHPSSSLNPNGGTQTNDLFVNVHVTNEPPDKVTLTLEATNTTSKVKVPLEVNIKATNSSPATELPLEVKAQNRKTDNVLWQTAFK